MERWVYNGVILSWILKDTGGDAQPTQDRHGGSPVDDDSDDHNEEGGGEDHLTGLAHRVSDGKCESYGTPQTGEHHGVLNTSRYLHRSAKVEDERKRVDVQEATKEDGDEGPNDVERVKVVLRESEHGDANVGEDEVLGHKVKKVKKALGGLLALLWQIVKCVMCLSYATEENRNNACEAEDLSEKEGWIGHEDKEGALEEGVLPDVGELRQQGCDAAHQAAYQETGTEDTKEI